MAWFATHGVKIRAVMTDNGPCYKAHEHRAAVRELGLRHLRIRPYRPRTNGKAERFIPDAARRMGLRTHLWQLSRAHRGAAIVPRALQLQTPTRLPRQEGTGYEVEQPRWELHLAARLRWMRSRTAVAGEHGRQAKRRALASAERYSNGSVMPAGYKLRRRSEHKRAARC